MIARPARSITENIARITISDSEVRTRFTEKDERFIKVVKRLGYHWDGRAWYKTLNACTGPGSERAAELGRGLLEAGFPVEFPDGSIQEMAVNGSYNPEQRLWIYQRTKGDYAGWFAISWPYGEDFYKQARRISGSRYDKPYVVVPAEHYDEVLDFADLHNFSLTEGARELADKAQQERETALIVELKALQKPEKREPERYDIASDLLDEPL